MERIVKEHEITTEHKLIREITKTYVTVGSEERLWDTHRGPLHLPGTLDGETYTPTDMKDLPTEVKDFAGLLWTEELQHEYEIHLKTLE